MYFPVPFDIYERIAWFCDIDTRRAMGFLPRKLPPTVVSDMNVRLRQRHAVVNRVNIFSSNMFVINHAILFTAVKRCDDCQLLYRFSKSPELIRNTHNLPRIRSESATTYYWDAKKKSYRLHSSTGTNHVLTEKQFTFLTNFRASI